MSPPPPTNIGFLTEEGVSEAVQSEFGDVEALLEDRQLRNPLNGSADAAESDEAADPAEDRDATTASK